MARDQMSNFSWYKFLVNFFFGRCPRSLHEPRTWRFPKKTQGWRGKLLVHKHTKSSGWVWPQVDSVIIWPAYNTLVFPTVKYPQRHGSSLWWVNDLLLKLAAYKWIIDFNIFSGLVEFVMSEKMTHYSSSWSRLRITYAHGDMSGGREI